MNNSSIFVFAKPKIYPFPNGISNANSLYGWRFFFQVDGYVIPLYIHVYIHRYVLGRECELLWKTQKENLSHVPWKKHHGLFLEKYEWKRCNKIKDRGARPTFFLYAIVIQFLYKTLAKLRRFFE